MLDTTIQAKIRNFSLAATLLALMLGMSSMPINTAYADDDITSKSFIKTVNDLFDAPSFKNVT